MTYVIVGASSGLGRALAEEYAARGHHIVVTARDDRDLAPLVEHLRIRHDVGAASLVLDLARDDLPLQQLDALLEGMPPLAGLLLPAGLNHDADAVGLETDILENLTRVNYLSACKLVNHLLPRIEANGGSLTGFGSVAGTRGRTRNAAYAAAKRALQSYFESLQHRAIGAGYHCQFYILGYVDTNLSFTEDLPLPAADPARLARAVYRRRHKTLTRFLPWFWYIPCKIIQMLPPRIFGRLSF